jgi:sulfate adenylyltransferase subunit 2
MNWRDTLIRLRQLEAEAITIMREVVAECQNPVMLYSIGKDSSTMLHIAQKAFYPSKPPFPLLHVDTTWKFREMIAFRDQTAARCGMELLVHVNEEGRARGVSPITSSSAVHAQVMKTEALHQALDKWKFDAAFSGARRDEEKSRGQDCICSHRSVTYGWDPRNQRPELWSLFNTRLKAGETMRVSPLLNWTELDIWGYIRAESIPVVRSVAFAAE